MVRPCHHRGAAAARRLGRTTTQHGESFDLTTGRKGRKRLRAGAPSAPFPVHSSTPRGRLIRDAPAVGCALPCRFCSSALRPLSPWALPAARFFTHFRSCWATRRAIQVRPRQSCGSFAWPDRPQFNLPPNSDPAPPPACEVRCINGLGVVLPFPERLQHENKRARAPLGSGAPQGTVPRASLRQSGGA